VLIRISKRGRLELRRRRESLLAGFELTSGVFSMVQCL
jgi:hypothetical protein